MHLNTIVRVTRALFWLMKMTEFKKDMKENIKWIKFTNAKFTNLKKFDKSFPFFQVEYILGFGAAAVIVLTIIIVLVTIK